MRVEPGKVRAPEIGRVWLNSAPLSFRQLRGRAVLVDFWDYTCVNCIRTLPYVQQWHERYRDAGLTVIGVHTPEFTFAQYETNVERAVRDFGLTYPIVVDSNYEIWKLFACRCWPTKFLIDKDGYLRFAQFGEGAYAECELAIQELLREINPALELPPVMRPLRDEDTAGARCYLASPELHLGHRRGKIGNQGSFQEDRIADYSFSGEPEENLVYVSGQWASTAEYMEAVGDGEHRLLLRYSARTVNLVMAAPRGGSCDLVILQEGSALTPRQASTDVRFRMVDGREQSYIPVSTPRMYTLVDNPDFGSHRLELLCPEGLAAFAFTFTTCVDPLSVVNSDRVAVHS
jgi:thiol-disulfide isomerase/thioredoxin